MRKRKKQKFNSLRALLPKIFFFFLILILAGLVKVNFNKFMEWSWARKDFLTQEKRIQEKKERREELEKFLDYLQSKEYLERTIKEKFNLVKPGEKIIYLLPEEEESLAGRREGETFWEKFIYEVKGIFKKE